MSTACVQQAVLAIVAAQKLTALIVRQLTLNSNIEIYLALEIIKLISEIRNRHYQTCHQVVGGTNYTSAHSHTDTDAQLVS